MATGNEQWNQYDAILNLISEFIADFDKKNPGCAARRSFIVRVNEMLNDYVQEAEDQEGTDYWLSHGDTDELVRDFGVYIEANMSVEGATIEEAIPYDIDNRDTSTTWLRFNPHYIEVDPWELVENLIENAGLPYIAEYTVKEHLKAIQQEINNPRLISR